VSAEAGTFVSVLVDPLMLLFVKVVVDVAETKSPDVLGSVNTVDPATAGACNVTDPLVSPAITTALIAQPTFVPALP
jgi:hypothetical protein